MGNTELMLNPVFPIYTKFFIVSRFVSTYIWKVGDCSTYLCQFLILESERQLLIGLLVHTFGKLAIALLTYVNF